MVPVWLGCGRQTLMIVHSAADKTTNEVTAKWMTEKKKIPLVLSCQKVVILPCQQTQAVLERHGNTNTSTAVEGIQIKSS